MKTKKDLINNDQGWTIIELLIIILVIVSFLGLFILSKNIVDKVRMNIELNNFVNYILYYQIKSTESNRDYAIRIYGKENSYTIYSQGIVYLSKKKSFTSGLEFSRNNDYSVDIRKSGYGVNNEIQLKYKEEKITIKILPISGQLTIERS